MSDLQTIQDRISDAATSHTALEIQGGGSKLFYGRAVAGQPLAVGGYRGIIDYTPSELVISARAGTPLSELEATLAQNGQMLAFEPPHFGATATLGGTVACGLSGPRRPWTGAARDFVLGVNCVNGKGEYLRFGGQVMKNVAGYDLSRTLTGSLGTLAVLLDVHLKVLPQPEQDITLLQPCTAAEAIERCNRWAAQPLPLSGACHFDHQLLIRLSGSARGLAPAVRRLGGEQLDDSSRFWEHLREQQLPFFDTTLPLWRVSVAPATAPLALGGEWLMDWGGAQRWLATDLPADQVRAAVQAASGHATLWRGGATDDAIFQPLPPMLLALHRRLKQTFDPAGILNPGRLYTTL
ncbi:MAG TPA: glycolate oxidase subunit GlcE [Gammaproteobacteria bacterium]|nr:glycolate oxidase subunit GlcE [Gammaproteobacteria bacterium]